MKTLEQVVDQLMRGESLAARSRSFVLAALAVWIVTSAIALVTLSPGFFSRAGAVGTGLVLAAFSVTTAARQYYQTHLMKGLVLVLRTNLRDREGRPLILPDAPAEPHDIAVRDYDHNLEAVSRLFARIDRRSSKARFVEVSAVVISTLQWGYGDLLINRTLVCGAWTC
jgi:hypothetical protein